MFLSPVNLSGSKSGPTDAENDDSIVATLHELIGLCDGCTEGVIMALISAPSALNAQHGECVSRR
jgi:hypothetical protein